MPRPRILGGVAKGRTLQTPRRGTRPSPAKLREALFDILAFRAHGSFLDLYSGSGAVGLEAASRGWSSTCVERDGAASDVIGRNAAALRLEVNVVRTDALRFVRAHPQEFDVVFAAPPYPAELRAAFQAILDANPAKPGGLYAFQHPSREKPVLTRGGTAAPVDTRKYGSNALTLVGA